MVADLARERGLLRRFPSQFNRLGAQAIRGPASHRSTHKNRFSPTPFRERASRTPRSEWVRTERTQGPLRRPDPSDLAGRSALSLHATPRTSAPDRRTFNQKANQKAPG
ncbi:hypothetical protein GCM10010420_06250 [Streptomyces glaucosporus]|uniref:Uncharacterized protein n=1 Tax=Streptomyces glaucosporus TaxID=284044 RepID=A0ABN3HRG3_9ACTN